MMIDWLIIDWLNERTNEWRNEWTMVENEWGWLTGPASQQFNSLAPGKFEWNFKCVIFKRILVIAG